MSEKCPTAADLGHWHTSSVCRARPSLTGIWTWPRFSTRHFQAWDCCCRLSASRPHVSMSTRCLLLSNCVRDNPLVVSAPFLRPCHLRRSIDGLDGPGNRGSPGIYGSRMARWCRSASVLGWYGSRDPASIPRGCRPHHHRRETRYLPRRCCIVLPTRDYSTKSMYMMADWSTPVERSVATMERRNGENASAGCRRTGRRKKILHWGTRSNMRSYPAGERRFEMKSDAGDRVSRRRRTRPTGLISTEPRSWFSITRSTAHEGGRAPTTEIVAIHNDHTAHPLPMGGQLSVIRSGNLSSHRSVDENELNARLSVRVRVRVRGDDGSTLTQR